MPTGPPELFNLESEMALCGAALIGGNQVMACPTVRSVAAADFWSEVHRDIWDAILTLTEAGQTSDLLTVADELAKQGELEAIGGQSALLQAVNACPSVMNADSYAAIVLEWSRRRKVLNVISELGATLPLDGPFNGTLQQTVDILGNIATSQKSKTWTSDELLSDTTPIPADLVDGFIYGNQAHLFSGPGGDGKSYEMLDMAICIARGTPWLGLNVRQTPVLIIDLENEPYRVRERYRDTLRGHALEDDPPPVHFCFDIEQRLDHDAGMVEVVNRADDVGAGFVILDSLVDFLGDVDENSNPEMGRVAERLRKIAVQVGSAEAIHHTPKNNNASPRGATALRNGVGVNILNSRDGKTVTLTQDKNRCGPEMTIKARLNWGDGLFNLSLIDTSVGRKSRPADIDEAAILDVLSDDKWHFSNEIIEAVMKETKHARSTVTPKLKAMARDCVVEAEEQTGGKPYRVRCLPYDPYEEALED